MNLIFHLLCKLFVVTLGLALGVVVICMYVRKASDAIIRSETIPLDSIQQPPVSSDTAVDDHENSGYENGYMCFMDLY
ncbi:hypothetical protein [Parapedobacter sp. DT-150]|uniref:hypothetical protein n=1 Tax=Parapedobacter sp. DT-150 TaxID=3396162 RepID=UPI003F1A1ECC